jgi:hypothetical protein
MPADHDGGGRPPTDSNELVKYLEAALRLTEAQDATAGFLLKLLLETLKSNGRGGHTAGRH